MFLSFHSSSHRGLGRNAGASLTLNGLLCILFGLAIIAAPELLAYIVAGFFIFAGVSLALLGWRMRR